MPGQARGSGAGATSLGRQQSEDYSAREVGLDLPRDGPVDLGFRGWRMRIKVGPREAIHQRPKMEVRSPELRPGAGPVSGTKTPGIIGRFFPSSARIETCLCGPASSILMMQGSTVIDDEPKPGHPGRSRSGYPRCFLWRLENAPRPCASQGRMESWRCKSGTSRNPTVAFVRSLR